MNKDFEALQPYLDKSMAMNTAMGLFGWDTETLAPKAAVDQTAKILGVIAGEAYNAIMNDEVKRIVYKLSDEIKEGSVNDLTEVEKGIVKELKKNYEYLEKIPEKEYKEYSELQAVGASRWAEAKNEDDISKFLPTLKSLIEYTGRFAGYRVKPGEKPYDVLLNDYEEGFNQEILDRFFNKLKEAIVPLLKKIKEKPQVDYDFLFKKYPIDRQKEFSRFVVQYLGFDMERGVMAESEHPFTGNLHNKDVRITNHYYEDNLESAIFSVIHEAGHGIYEMNIPDELTLTPVGGGSSMGLHESQSRFCENIIGRSKAFWEPIYGRLVEIFPEQLKDVNLDKFITAINRTEAGLIRTEADELTYSLHVLVRYEVEKKIFNENYPVEELPKLWDDLYEEYLGVRPNSYKDGILQDIHWAGGSFGYFSSYALGNAIGAQLYHQMKKEMDFDGLLRKGEVSKIIDWLKEKVHKYGKLKNTNEILLLATGEEFNADYYVEYLTEKFTREYGL